MLKENIFQSELISIAYAKIRKMVNLKDHHTWIQKTEYYHYAYLFGNGATIDLNFHDMCLLLAPTENFLLGMTNCTNHGTILFNLIQIFFDFFFTQSIVPFQLSFWKSFLLRFRPDLSDYKYTKILIKTMFHRVSSHSTTSNEIGLAWEETINLIKIERRKTIQHS